MTLENDFERYMRSVLDSGHESRPGADAPPANTWEQVLAKVQPLDEEGDDMTATTLTTDASRSPGFPSRHGVYPRVPPKKSSRGFGHYLNLAATIAIVVAVAVAGWFATSQLNQSGGPEPRFAIMSASPEASPEAATATCDVEPLSTDRVMEIVRNPARFAANGPTGEPSDTVPNLELSEPNQDLMLAGETIAPSEEQFSSASEVVNEYLACMVNGTQSQIWTFYSPVSLQQKILAEFPVFANEQQVRERVEELASQPAYLAEFHWDRGSIRESSQ